MGRRRPLRNQRRDSVALFRSRAGLSRGDDLWYAVEAHNDIIAAATPIAAGDTSEEALGRLTEAVQTAYDAMLKLPIEERIE